MQKMYIKCLIIDNKISNYSEAIYKFKENFKNINFYYQRIQLKKY